MARTKIKDDTKIFTLANFSGLNNSNDSTQIADNEAQDLSNVIFTKDLAKRGGYTEVNSTAISGSTGIYGLGAYYQADGTRELLYASHTTIGKLTVGTGATASLITSLTSNQRTRFETFQDLIIAVNGSDSPQKYNGTTGEDLGGSPPTTSYIALHKNYMFLAGNSTYKSRLYYSNIDDCETWGANDFVDVNTDDGDKIIGLQVTLDSLVIFKEYNVYILYGDTPTYTEGLTLWRIKKASTDTGAVSQGSINVFAKNLIYMSRNKGVQVFGGAATSGEVAFDSITSAMLSEKITPTIDGLNETRFSQAEAIGFDNKYILSLPNGSSTTNNLNLVYDYAKPGWSLWNIPANCWCVFRTSGRDYLYFGSTTTGKIYRYTPTTYSDNGTAISAYYKTKDFDLSTKYDTLTATGKLFRRFYVTVNKASDFTLTVEPEVDFGDTDVDSYSIGAVASDSLWGTMVWGTNKWGAATASPSPKQIMNARGKFINYKFSNETLSENIRVRNLTQFYRIEGAR